MSLYPQKGGFTVQLVLGKTLVEKTMALDLGEVIRKKLQDTSQLHDGKWLFIPFETPRDDPTPSCGGCGVLAGVSLAGCRRGRPGL